MGEGESLGGRAGSGSGGFLENGMSPLSFFSCLFEMFVNVCTLGVFSIAETEAPERCAWERG